MIWDMETGNAWDPLTYIPYVVSQTRSWSDCLIIARYCFLVVPERLQRITPVVTSACVIGLDHESAIITRRAPAAAS